MIDNLFNEDCLAGMSRLQSSSIDAVVTDPPYRVISGGTHSEWKSGWQQSVLKANDGKIFEHNGISHYDWMKECYRVLKPNSHFMTNFLNLYSLMGIAMQVGFKLHNLLVWEKNTCNANRWYMKNCEYRVFCRKGEAKTINQPSSKTVVKFDNIVGSKLHPTEKPVDLMKLYITDSTNEEDVVLDPFAGSGSTAVAAILCNRHFIAFELDKNYYEVAKKRIDEVMLNTLL